MVRMDVLSLYLALDEVLSKSACLWFSRCLIAFLLHISPFSLRVLFGLFLLLLIATLWPCTLLSTVSEERHQMSSQCYYVRLHEQFAAKLLANKVAYNKISIHFSLTLFESHKVQHYRHILTFIEEKKPSEIYLFLVNVHNKGHWIGRISPFYLQCISLVELMWMFTDTDTESAWMGVPVKLLFVMTDWP